LRNILYKGVQRKDGNFVKEQAGTLQLLVEETPQQILET